MVARQETVDKVSGTIKKYRMLKPEYKVLVAVSGGADSLCLLYVLRELRASLGLDLNVFHLNHGIRGKAADQDAKYVSDLAEELRLPATVLSADVPAYAKQHKLSVEEAAREVRYELLYEVGCEIKANRIALGHTADDQVETFLMRLIRGAGLEGLRGMPAVRGPYIRPLIEVTHDEAAAFLQGIGVTPRFDETNLDQSLLRNRLRHELIPLLAADYNPSLKEDLLNTIELIQSDTALLDDLTRDAMQDVGGAEGKSIVLSRDRLMKLPRALQRRVVRESIKRLKGDLRGVTFRHVEDVLDKVLQGRSGARIELPERLIARREYDRILMEFDKDKPTAKLPLELAVPLETPGETKVLSPAVTIKARVVRRSRLVFSEERQVAYLDQDKLAFPLTLRAAKPGDRFRPLGMTGTKKLQDFFVDLKVPRAQRDSALVVESGGRIAWVVGHRVADDFRVTEGTKNVLVLRRQ